MPQEPEPMLRSIELHEDTLASVKKILQSYVDASVSPSSAMIRRYRGYIKEVELKREAARRVQAGSQPLSAWDMDTLRDELAKDIIKADFKILVKDKNPDTDRTHGEDLADMLQLVDKIAKEGGSSQEIKQLEKFSRRMAGIAAHFDKNDGIPYPLHFAPNVVAAYDDRAFDRLNDELERYHTARANGRETNADTGASGKFHSKNELSQLRDSLSDINWTVSADKQLAVGKTVIDYHGQMPDIPRMIEQVGQLARLPSLQATATGLSRGHELRMSAADFEKFKSDEIIDVSHIRAQLKRIRQTLAKDRAETVLTGQPLGRELDQAIDILTMVEQGKPLAGEQQRQLLTTLDHLNLNGPFVEYLDISRQLKGSAHEIKQLSRELSAHYKAFGALREKNRKHPDQPARDNFVLPTVKDQIISALATRNDWQRSEASADAPVMATLVIPSSVDMPRVVDALHELAREQGGKAPAMRVDFQQAQARVVIDAKTYKPIERIANRVFLSLKPLKRQAGDKEVLTIIDETQFRAVNERLISEKIPVKARKYDKENGQVYLMFDADAYDTRIDSVIRAIEGERDKLNPLGLSDKALQQVKEALRPMTREFTGLPPLLAKNGAIGARQH